MNHRGFNFFHLWLYVTLTTLSLVARGVPEIDWVQVDHIQERLIKAYGNKVPIRDYKLITMRMYELERLQARELKNNRSQKLIENHHLSQDMLKELVYFSHRLQSELNDPAFMPTRDDIPEDLPSYLSLLSMLQLAQQHLANGANYFTTPQVNPVQHPPGYQPPPAYSQHPPQNPHQNQPGYPPPPSYAQAVQQGQPGFLPGQWPNMQYNRPLSPVEKLGIVVVASVLAHLGIRWWFTRGVESKLKKSKESLQELDAKCNELAGNVEACTTDLVKLKKDIKDLPGKVDQEINVLQSSLDDMKAQLKEESKELKTQLNTDISALNQRAEQDKRDRLAEINVINTQVTSQERHLSDMKASLASLRGAVKEGNSRMHNLAKKNGALRHSSLSRARSMSFSLGTSTGDG